MIAVEIYMIGRCCYEATGNVVWWADLFLCVKVYSPLHEIWLFISLGQLCD